MVWGISLPRSGGPYGPYGEFEGPVDHYGGGWNHRLKTYFREQMSDEERAVFEDGAGNGALRYSSFAWGKLIYEIGTKDGPDGVPFTPIEAHEPPRFFSTEKGYDQLASIISLPGRVWAVDEPMKTIVERLEPDIHQFFPIEIRMPRGKVYPVCYFTLVVGRYIDSLVPDKCKEGVLRPNGPHKYHSDDSKKAIAGRAFSRAKFGNAHLWRERAFGEWFTCLSDELHDEIRKMNLLMPKYYRMIEV